MKIDFYLRFRTKFGESLYITGNVAALQNEDQNPLPLKYLNNEFWHVSIDVDPKQNPSLHYQYILKNDKDEWIKEGEKDRVIDLKVLSKEQLSLLDTWNYAGEFENAFYTTPFQEVYFKYNSPKIKKPKQFTHSFKVKAPLLQPDECICILGNVDALTNWNMEQPVLMAKNGDWWSALLSLTENDLPATYKYGVYNFKKKKFIRYETGDNRMLHDEAVESGVVVLHDGFVRLPNTVWKGSGVAIPVFSLRSNDSFGVGEFNDIKLLADWSAQVGLKLIQLLPVNDTSATFTWVDSYPYAAISAFALHPIYINLSTIAGKKSAALVRSISKKQKQLNGLAEVDYEKVMQFKLQILRELFEANANEFMQEEEFQNFFEANEYWLKPYAAFSHLRDKYGTADFNQWKTNKVYSEKEVEKLSNAKNKASKEIKFYYFIQYHLHLQLKDAADYVHKKGLALKGDIPIGIYRYSVDAWTAPELYHMNWQAGAPPDDFAVKGQNWGFPTYNWQRMQENNFEWWRRRFEQMSSYFDAFRIDHILGFFRIWSIPLDAVEGILGRFVPALPVQINEFGENGIWFDYDRYCKPFINDSVLQQVFGAQADVVRNSFLQQNERGEYDLLPAFDTQRKIEDYFNDQDRTEDNDRLKIGLFDLVSNVILLEEQDSNREKFHFRISIEDTTSFQYLDEQTRRKIKELYVNYFYRRQDDFWEEEALNKLPYLKEATDMLICGEDLGMVPHCVPMVMKDLGILSLEIQRMPKDIKVEFFLPQNAPYLSVITPSTHDMSTIRGWWEEDRTRTQHFYNTVLESQGAAPYFCEPWINRAIVLQHLYSPAMWSIFQLQDLLGMSETLRRENPHEERINQPANPKHYWQYRMHLSLEQLIKEKEFNDELKDYVTNSGRA